MSFLKKRYLRLKLSNIARTIAYGAYEQYDRKIAKKMPLYDLEVVSLIRRLPAEAVCIDIGTNEGQLFGFMVKHCHKGKVYGFEPIPHLYKFLVNTFSSNAVQVYPYILSDKEEEASFYYFPTRSGISGMSRRLSLFPRLSVEEVKSRTHVLDQLLDLSRIDFIKIDVEGAELKVLNGAKQLIHKCQPVIVFECQDMGLNYFNTLPEQVFSFFWEMGYGISLLKYYLQGLPHMEKDTLINLTRHRYEYQFVAWPSAADPLKKG